jgi:transcriptional regulator with XRE-family HTH domain
MFGLGTYVVALVMPPPLSTATAAFGERVRSHRQALGLSQEALADRCGVHWTFLGQVERGQRNLTLHNILKLAAGLKVDPAELIKGLKPPKSRTR